MTLPAAGKKTGDGESTREDILKRVWGDDDYFIGRSMDVFISRLRKYLKDDERLQIINIHGVGFKMTLEK